MYHRRVLINPIFFSRRHGRSFRGNTQETMRWNGSASCFANCRVERVAGGAGLLWCGFLTLRNLRNLRCAAKWTRGAVLMALARRAHVDVRSIDDLKLATATACQHALSICVSTSVNQASASRRLCTLIGRNRATLEHVGVPWMELSPFIAEKFARCSRLTRVVIRSGIVARAFGECLRHQRFGVRFT